MAVLRTAAMTWGNPQGVVTHGDVADVAER